MKIFRNLMRLFLFLFLIWPFAAAAALFALLELISDTPRWDFYRELWTLPSCMQFWSFK